MKQPRSPIILILMIAYLLKVILHLTQSFLLLSIETKTQKGFFEYILITNLLTDRSNTRYFESISQLVNKNATAINLNKMFQLPLLLFETALA